MTGFVVVTALCTVGLVVAWVLFALGWRSARHSPWQALRLLLFTVYVASTVSLAVHDDRRTGLRLILGGAFTFVAITDAGSLYQKARRERRARTLTPRDGAQV